MLTDEAGPEASAGTSDQPLAAQYDLLEKIGDGGMGVVYLGRDRRLGRYVAVKRLHRSAMVRPALRERFFREAKAIAALNHAHIVHVYALGEDHHGPYIVMEYVAGPRSRSPGKVPPYPFTLADRVHHEGPLPAGPAIELMLKLCHAVAYAHACGVIHRDLKPSNVLLTEGGEPKIVDFGLARCLLPGEEQLTVPGERMLSLGYGAPEQEMDASTTDERADIYGLGALLYFAVTGKNPRYFRESDVPETLRPALVKALETDRNRRWGSVNEFAAALDHIRAPSTEELPRVKSTWRCKWCDTVNPISLQYCGMCGWDGGEECAECGAAMRFGVRFCGECGADAREYEMARLLQQRLAARLTDRDYAYVLQQADRISGFKPAGARGRQIIEQVRELERCARQTTERLAQLRDQIPRDLAAGNCATAGAAIEEYNALAKQPAFLEEQRVLPSLIRRAEIARIQAFLDRGEWRSAEQAFRALSAKGEDSGPEIRSLRNALRRARWRRRSGTGVLTGIVLFGLYVYSAAPAYRRTGSPGETFRKVYRCVFALHRLPGWRESLDAYARLWGVPHMFEPPPAPPSAPAPSPEHPVLPEEEQRLATLRGEYEQALDQIDADIRQRLSVWPQRYLQALRELQENIRRQGDYEGWSTIEQEASRFETEMTLPPEALVESLPALRALQERFERELAQLGKQRSERIVAATQHYLKQLTEQQKQFTIQGRMDAAALFHAEIKRVRASPRVAQAEQDLVERPPSRPHSSTSNSKTNGE